MKFVHLLELAALVPDVGQVRRREGAPLLFPRVARQRDIGASEQRILVAQSNIAITYKELGRHEEALRLNREVYSGFLRLNGEEYEGTVQAALNLSTSLVNTSNFAEARAFTRKQMKLATRVLGSDHRITLDFQWGYTRAFTLDKDVSAEQLAEVATTLEKTLKTAQRVLGREHPDTCSIHNELATAREEIARRQGA